MADTKKVAIIGGGLGGMACAIALATDGYSVELFEKNGNLGGKLNVLKEKGFSFDLGPSIFTLPQMFSPLFENSGRKMADYISLKKVEPQWRNFFEDQTIIDLYSSEEKMRQELERFGTNCFQEYQNFVRYSKTQYDIVDRGYFAQGLDTFWSFLKFYGLFGATKLDWHSSMATGIKRHIHNKYLQDIFEYFIKYVGSSAYASPGFMNLMPNIQIEFGLWYVDGGMYKLAEGLERLMRELGIKIHLHSEVVSILEDGKKAIGLKIKENGSEHDISADYVVSNMEVIPAYEKLLQETPRFLKSLEKFEPACSGIVIHLGTKKIYPQLAHHNFFYSKDQKHHFDLVFRQKKLPEDPTIYLVAPTRSDPTQAPEGCDNIKILPHIPYINEKNPYTQADYIALKDRVLDKLERMGLTDLRKNTIVEDFWTPFDIEKRYYSNRGSIYGVVSDIKKNFAFKAPKKSTRVQNLYFVGGSVNPGGGMPMVVLTGRHVAKMIAQESQKS